MRPSLIIGCVTSALLAAGAILLDQLAPLDLTRPRDISFEVIARDGTPLRTFVTRDGMLRLRTSVDDVDAHYLNLLLETEDKRFWQHPGVDPFALVRGFWQFARTGRVVSGGSTITMQVARMLSPHRRNLTGKFIDIARALQLEARYGKREILDMYLTLAPMGGNLEGARAAARIYFGREPYHLTPDQAALLVAIPRSPARLRPDRSPAAAKAAIVRLCERAERTPVPCGRGPFDLPVIVDRRFTFRAAHLADFLRQKGGGPSVRTTIDATLQTAIENVVTQEAHFLGSKANVAVLVVANRDRAVLAYIGGADYFGPAGMVDIIRAPRSPGSTLKPFLYGIAFDESILAPDTIVEDGPWRFGDYAPEDFDRKFHGMVTAREALQQSYNSPAVQLISAIGASKFASILRQSGARLGFPSRANDPSLPLALGGVGMTLGDLAMLYSGLANQGHVAPLRILSSDTPGKGTSVVTARSAELLSEILRNSPTPDGVPSVHARGIAYKTGTSYGFRDALAVGYSNTYTVAVWVGRTEGTPRPGSFGRTTAAPILFRIFDLLPQEPKSPGSTDRVREADHAAAGLQRFMPTLEPILRTMLAVDPPRILFPPSGAQLELTNESGARTSLDLQAAGGTPPYRWFINGQPLPPAPPGGSPSWVPDGPGLVHITVSDQNNGNAVSEVWIK